MSHILIPQKWYNEQRLGRENGKREADYLIYGAKKPEHIIENQ